MLALLASISGAAGATAPGPSLDRFERLRAQDLRVATVAYQLSIANAARCAQVLAPQLGFVVDDLAHYAPADRADAARAFGLDDGPGIAAVVAGSPADRAGLRAGDRLVAVNGQPFDHAGSPAIATSAGVESAQHLLGKALRHGPIVLRVAAPGGERELRFTAESGCATNVELIPGGAVNAWADGSRVMVSGGLLAHCATDGDLALVIGHEMAHNLLHHRRRLAAEGIVSSALLPAAAGSRDLRAVRETEEEADALAVGLATTAAYDLGDAEPFLSGLLGGGAPVAATHPAPDRRLALLRAAIAAARQGREHSVALTG